MLFLRSATFSAWNHVREPIKEEASAVNEIDGDSSEVCCGKVRLAHWEDAKVARALALALAAGANRLSPQASLPRYGVLHNYHLRFQKQQAPVDA